ncbi:uncharacterized protein A1O5_11687 [Cladophialophora psammophila CBS 110553]|uniref:SnoaL-like domain-containing protein n=1 Tax=Cladophialophora psammophila CBS 110553 TaxID=1182543 RepID=W9WFN2_9EURO|nr:uncharacterized protein A1O5_11687 [Cladophialophora psammophila CBS 110553]EXJ63366.1 hypothetical protein A1O5_11687 [Cladophialophora psammophila CBS 110553]
MGYNTEGTEWPADNVTPSVKALIDRFFNLLDNTGSDVGNILADEIFAKDAVAQFGMHTFEGSEQIRKSRDNAWTLFTARQHRVLRVYTHDKEGTDLLFIGHVAMDLKNGKHVAGEFTGRFTIADASSPSPQLKSYAIWADSGPLLKALQGN